VRDNIVAHTVNLMKVTVTTVSLALVKHRSYSPHIAANNSYIFRPFDDACRKTDFKLMNSDVVT
jgi:hypothetical protein